MEREYGQGPDYSSNGNRRYTSHTNPGYRNNSNDRHAPQGIWRHNDRERERDMDDHPSGQNQYGYNLSGQGMGRAARGYTPSARGGSYVQQFDTHFSNNNNNNNNGNHRQEYNMHADPPSLHNTNRNLENTYAYVKTTVGPNDTPRGPFRSTSESLTNPNPSETLKAYQQNTGQHGRDLDSAKGFGGTDDYQGLGSTNAFFDQMYEKLHPDQGKLDRGFADKNTGTKTTKTITRTFSEMATQTTEDDMPESTYNGVSIGSVTRTSTAQPSAVEQVPKPHRTTDQPPSHVARPSNMTRDMRDTRDVREVKPKREMELKREMEPKRDLEPKREIEPKRVQVIHKDELRDYTNHRNRTPSNPPPISKIETNQWTSEPTVPISDGNQAASDGWGNVAANKAVGEMVDWSSGAVAEFPEEAKPTKMTVTHHWNQSPVQKAPVQPLPTSWGPPKKEEPKAEQTHGQPSTSNLGLINQRNVAQTQGRSAQETKGNEDPWLTDHQGGKSSTNWASSTTGHSPPDDQDAWIAGGNNNNNGGSNEWSFMADTAKASWNTPVPAPTSWGSTPGVKTVVTPPEQALSSWSPPVSTPSAQPTSSWDQPVSAPPAQPTSPWDQPVSAPEQPSTSWGSTSASSTGAKKVPLTSTERFNNSLQKLAAGYGGLSNRNNGSYEHTPPPAPITSRWVPSSSNGGSDQAQTQPQQTRHRRTPSSSSTHSAANTSSSKVDPKDTPPPPVKAPVKALGPNSRRIQHTIANTPERESAAAAWVAASKSFSTKPPVLTTTTTTATVGSTSEGATPETQASKITSRGRLTTSSDFQSFLNASSKFVPPVPIKKEAPAPEEVSKENEAKEDQTAVDPEPEAPKAEEEKKEEEEEKHCEEKHEDEEEEKHEDVRSDGGRQSYGDHSAKGSGPNDSGQPSESGDNAWGETVEKGRQAAKDDGAHQNLIVLEEIDKKGNKDVADKLLQDASDKLEALERAGQVEPKVAVEAALPVSPEAHQDGPDLMVATKTALSVSPESPMEPKIAEASLPVSPEIRQDSPVELKVAVETVLPVSPPALQDGQDELKVAAETTLPVSPPALDAGPVELKIAETTASVSPVS
ncbi:hypothetical protein BG000_000405 [Podila horticola]|nr:hypothetical protein BG000_000405 [Podila horticola]